MNLFNTERLIVRQLTLSDLDAYYDMVGNPKVMQFVKTPLTYNESKKELKRFISYYLDDSIFFNIWGVIEQQTNTLIGICGVYNTNKLDYELAYRLREQFWGKGYGKEVTKGLIQYCFNNLNIDEVTAYVQIENIGSIRILEQEMQFVKEFYNEERKCMERIYKLKKSN